MHDGKHYKALIDSGAAISLVRYSTYQNIDNHLKTAIQSTSMHLNTADGSPMTALGITTLQLQIANFKFSHNVIICDRLPNTKILLGIDVQIKFTLYPAWNWERNCYIQKECISLPTLETMNRRQMSLLWNQPLWYCPNTAASYPWRAKDIPLRDISPISSVIKTQEGEGHQYTHHQWNSQHQEKNKCLWFYLKLHQNTLTLTKVTWRKSETAYRGHAAAVRRF